jgi:hypothetical protein
MWAGDSGMIFNSNLVACFGFILFKIKAMELNR